MFEGIRRAHRLSSMGSEWVQATSLDLGDGEQIVRAASGFMDEGTSPEDAWLTAMLRWIQNMPWLDRRKAMGHALQLFLDRYETELPFHDELVWTAWCIAEEA